jgi:phosphate transport system protein
MRQLDEQLHDLLQRVSRMGINAEVMIQKAVSVLTSRSEEPASEIFMREDEVNALQVEIDERAIKLTALHQPVARDVRFLFMATKIASELERVADQAVNICQNSHYVLECPATQLIIDVPIMAEIVQQMVRDSLTAMIDRDVNKANFVLEEEQKVDAFRDRIFRALLADIAEGSREVQRNLSLILIARNLERIGDHAPNIAEEVIYWIHGRDGRHGKGVPAQEVQKT